MRIDLLGAEFSIKTDQDPVYLEEVVEVYREKVNEVLRTVGTSDNLKTAILAGILTADELLQQKGVQRTDDAVANRIALEMLSELDAVLESDQPGLFEDPPPDRAEV
jgi:cell division protein ZapA (FtsZ GTPase activity inhibitor)